MKSTFYDVPGFIGGKSSLNTIELGLLGDVSGKSILHLQCHFGQDSLSMSRMGAEVTGIDISDVSINSAQQLSEQIGVSSRFICSDIYDLPNHLSDTFDIVFTSYGVIGWLPDLDKWANTIKNFLRPDGVFILVEFHPVVWMYDDDFQSISYSYFNKEMIEEKVKGSYTSPDVPITTENVMWNHGIAEVYNALKSHGLVANHFQEYDYSPYNCFPRAVQVQDGKYMITGLEGKIPLVYSIMANLKDQ